jgi:hypothetical protein
MIHQVGHLVKFERVNDSYKPSGRRHTEGQNAKTKAGKKAL